MGSVQRLSNGNTLINGGYDNSSNQSNMWEVTPAGEVVWELALDNEKNLASYRALKYSWTPCAPVNSTGLKVKNITSSSAKIQWKLVKNAVSYDVQYRKLGSSKWKTKTSTTAAKNINNLLPNTTYQYQVRSHCANGYIGDFTSIKTFTTLPQRLVSGQESVVALQLHPNPTDGILNLDVDLDESQSVTISVYDLTGRLMFTSTQQSSGGEQLFQFDLHDLPAAIYLATVQLPSGSQSIRFVKE